MTDDRDRELDEWLAPLRAIKPAETDLARWRLALREVAPKALARCRERNRLAPRARRLGWLGQLSAAAAVGFIVGGLAFGYHAGPSPSAAVAQQEPTATIEHIYAKSE